MEDHKDEPIQNASKRPLSFSKGWFSSITVLHAGLAPEARTIPQLVEDLQRTLSLWAYKQRVPCIWVVFLGGTGTGKSTLFNAVCGKPLSEAGVERPKTCGPIAYTHGACPIQKDFPFTGTAFTRFSSGGPAFTPVAGLSGHLVVLDHERENWRHLVLVDTPDLDSVEVENRKVSEALYFLCDAVVFITSQEKYADEVPALFLKKILKERKPCYLIFNKADDAATTQEVLETLIGRDVSPVKDRTWSIPYSPGRVLQNVAESQAFIDFHRIFSSELSQAEASRLHEETLARYREECERALSQLIERLGEEKAAASNWLNQLRTLAENASRDLIHEQKDRFEKRSSDYLRAKIRRLFARYDVLARPRQMLKQVVLAPLRFLGVSEAESPDPHKRALQKVREKIDLVPIQTGIEKFNRLVLEKLSPSDETAPLFAELRKPGLALTGEEVKALIWNEQDKLDQWLEQTFDDIAEGIPASKKWGIYTTSILWGILIVAFEITVGGGFSILDAALDSTLAPFVTKGAVELFAYHEIRKIARQLAERYQEGLVSLVARQQERYEQCLYALLTPQEAVKGLMELQSHIRTMNKEARVPFT